MGANYHVARVTTSDEAWAAFRQAALAQGTPVSRYLGRLVEAELERRQTRPVRRVSDKPGVVEDGLAALREVRLAIDELDAIAGRLARETAHRGGRWDDIGAALKMRPSATRPPSASAHLGPGTIDPTGEGRGGRRRGASARPFRWPPDRGRDRP